MLNAYPSQKKRELLNIKYKLKVARRRVRGVTLKVDYNGLLVIAPRRLPDEEIRKIIRENQNWIRKTTLRVHMIMMKANALRLKRRSEENFEAISLRLISGYSKELGVSAKEVKFRNMRTRWGSCGANGRITLSKRAAFPPDNLLKFVVYHEVCHLKHFNHSKEFWQIVSKRFPEYKELRQVLFSYDAKIRSVTST